MKEPRDITSDRVRKRLLDPERAQTSVTAIKLGKDPLHSVKEGSSENPSIYLIPGNSEDVFI